MENYKTKESLNRQNQKMKLKLGPISSRFKVTSFVVITTNLEFNSTCRKKQFFSEYIDGAKSTHTILDVLQEKRSDDDWNVEANRILSDSWTGFTKYTLLKNLKGVYVVLRETDKIQATTRLENVWLEVWTKIGKAAQKREKSKNGQTRSQNSIMLAGLEAFISLIRK